MAVLYTNNASGTLSAGITTGATSITLNSGQGTSFPSPTGSDYFMATIYNVGNTLEIVKVTARSADTLTVVRAQEGTAAYAYSAGDKVDCRITAGGLANKVDKDTGGTIQGNLTVSGTLTHGAGTVTTPFQLLTTGAQLTTPVAGAAEWDGTNIYYTQTTGPTRQTVAYLSSNVASATKLATARTIGMTGDVSWTSPSFDGTGNVTAAATLATVNSNVGTYGSGTAIPTLTLDAKGRVTAASTTTVLLAPSASFNGLKLTSPGNQTTITVTAAYVTMLGSGVTAVVASNLSATLSIASNGAVNTLDTGTAATTTWYYVFAISNGSTTGTLASLSATAPTMPSGYTYKTRIGAFLTDGSANVAAYVQYGRRAQWINLGSGLPLMAAGPAGNVSTPTYASVSIASYAPPTASTIGLLPYLYDQPAGNQYILVAPNGSYGPLLAIGGGGINIPYLSSYTYWAAPLWMPLESSSVYWAANDTHEFLYALGWEDNL